VTLSALKLLVRRRNRYPLLLERMKKSSQPESQMRTTCESAFAALQELNSEVNERVRQMEARLHMTAVLLLVEGVDHLIEAGRLLHLEALVDMKSPTASTLIAWGRRATYKWYVFSDYLLVCRPKGEGFAKKALWPLAALRVAAANTTPPETHASFAKKPERDKSERDTPEPLRAGIRSFVSANA